jgi:uncharacterized membrane protein
MFALSLATSVAFVALTQGARAQATYQLDQVGVPDPPDVYSYFALDMNDNGEVVGGAYATEGFWPFLWRNGKLTRLPRLPRPPYPYAVAYGINNNSQVVGESYAKDYPGYRPVLWEHRRIRDTGALTDFSTVSATDLNVLGMIIGDAQDTGRRAFVQMGSQVSMLEPFSDGPGYTSAARINEHGVIAGTAWTATGSRAVVWIEGQIHDLGLPAGADSASAGAINDSGHVVGASQSGEFGVVQRPILWRNGEITELPLFASGQYEGGGAGGINNAGQIVGTNNTSTGSIPVLWQDGQVYNLNDLIRADDPLRPHVELQGVQLINNRGQILAQGTDLRLPGSVIVYRLTPSGEL